jgi:hypothetical protein
VAFVLLGLAAVLAVLPLRTLAGKTLTFARDDLTLTTAGRERFQTKYNPYYPIAKQSVAFLRRPGSRPGPIQVLGDFDLQYQSRREMAIAITGNTPEQLDGRLWRKMRQELRATRPPYVFVSDDANRLMRDRSPETARQIAHDFCRLHHAPDGWWFADRADPACG